MKSAGVDKSLRPGGEPFGCCEILSEATPHDRMLNMKKSLFFAVCLLSVIPATMHAGDKKPPKPATSKQDSYMQGRIFSAIEDSICCVGEALRKLEYANEDINKLEYPVHTRWMTRYWYAKMLLKKRDRKKAAKFVLLAQQDAQSLGTREQKDTQELAEEIQAKAQ